MPRKGHKRKGITNKEKYDSLIRQARAAFDRGDKTLGQKYLRLSNIYFGKKEGV